MRFICVLSFIALFGCNKTEKKSRDYLLLKPLGEIDNIMILHIDDKVKDDSLYQVMLKVLNNGARLVILNRCFHKDNQYDTNLHNILKSHINIVIPESISEDVSFDKYKPLSVGHDRYLTKKLDSKYDLTTSFEKTYNTSSGELVEHIAYESVKKFDPRFEYIFKALPTYDEIDIIFFGNQYFYNVIEPTDLECGKWFVNDKIVIIGDVNNKTVYTPFRFWSGNDKKFKGKPDLSSTLLLANSIETLLLLTYDSP